MLRVLCRSCALLSRFWHAPCVLDVPSETRVAGRGWIASNSFSDCERAFGGAAPPNRSGGTASYFTSVKRSSAPPSSANRRRFALAATTWSSPGCCETTSDHRGSGADRERLKQE